MKPEKMKVLFVDDMTSIRSVARTHFRKLGISNFCEAGDGMSALRLTETACEEGAPFDLILSDLNMPGMSGFEFLKAVRRHPNLTIQKTKFIMITAKPQNILRAVDLGANQCLHKPFDEAGLGLRLVWVFGDQWQGEHFVLSESQSTSNEDLIQG